MTVSSSNEPSNISEPMSVRDIIETGWRLYASNFSQYFLIAVIATIWSLVPTVFDLLTTYVPSYLGTSLSPGIKVLTFVVWAAIAIYFVAQSLGLFTSISRITYYQLFNNRSNNDSEPAEDNLLESNLLESSLQFTRSRKFYFLGANILQSIILLFTGVSLLIVMAVFFGVVGGVTRAIVGEAGINSAIRLLFLLLFSGCLVIFIGIYLYVFARFMLFEQPLAIEPRTDVFGAFSRSWELTQYGIRRTMLFAFGLNLIAFLMLLIPLAIASVLAPTDPVSILSAKNPDPALVDSALLPFYITTLLSSIVINISLTPLFRTTFTTLYFDLQNRFERRAFRENMLNQSSE